MRACDCVFDRVWYGAYDCACDGAYDGTYDGAYDCDKRNIR